MGMDRLETVAPDLMDHLKHTSEAHLQQAALVCCRFAVTYSGINNPITQEALQQLEERQVGGVALLGRLEELANALDEDYFRQRPGPDDEDLKVSFMASVASDIASEKAFRQARAASALHFALQAGTGLAEEAIYETIAATDLNQVRSLVDGIITVEASPETPERFYGLGSLE